VPAGDRRVELQVDMRYAGQGFELSIPIAEEDLRRLVFDELRDTFDAEHEKLFGFRLDIEHEVVNVRAIVQGTEEATTPDRLEQGGLDASGARTERTRLWIDGGHHGAWLYDRDRLQAGNEVIGPAIVTEMDSTTLILPDHHAEVDAYGNLLIRPR
jgi:N-methylhydantoinase A